MLMWMTTQMALPRLGASLGWNPLDHINRILLNYFVGAEHTLGSLSHTGSLAGLDHALRGTLPFVQYRTCLFLIMLISLKVAASLSVHAQVSCL